MHTFVKQYKLEFYGTLEGYNMNNQRIIGEMNSLRKRLG